MAWGVVFVLVCVGVLVLVGWVWAVGVVAGL